MDLFYRFRGWWVSALFVLALWVGLGCIPFAWFWLLGLVPAIALRIWARSHIGTHTRGAVLAAPALARNGPYALLRHPLYLSNILLSCAILGFWLGGGLWLLAFLVGLGGFYFYMAKKEDGFLQKSFGDIWSKYCNDVPGGLIPRSLHVKSAPAERTIVQAVWGDLWTWIWLALSIGVLVVLRGISCTG